MKKLRILFQKIKKHNYLLSFSGIFFVLTFCLLIISAILHYKKPINDYQNMINIIGYTLLGISFILAIITMLFFMSGYIVKNNYESKYSWEKNNNIKITSDNNNLKLIKNTN